jgi:molecular chaperone GrpE
MAKAKKSPPPESLEPQAPEEAPPESAASVEPSPEPTSRFEEEIAALKDKYLRLAAEYDNFRRRTIKERIESSSKAQAELIERLVDGLDDLTRFAGVDVAATDAKTLHDGVDMVRRKFWKVLDAAGLTRIDQSGVPFNPTIHEAVTMAPAPTEAEDHTVGTVLQAGYKLGDQLIRPARVIVLNWTAEPN